MSITLTHVKGPEAGSPNKQLHNSDISVPLPAVLGRGALLKCAEKKVSRRHATLDWDDDGVLINSVHVSPTFVIVNGVKQKLSQGESAVLGHGDKFGLLDDAFWFRVTIENSKQSCNKENTLIGSTEAESEHEKSNSKSIQENGNYALNQKKEIITKNKFEDSKEGKLNDETSTIVKNERVSEYIKKLSFSSNNKLTVEEGTPSTSSKVVCIENQTASTSNEEVTSSYGAAKVSLTLYTPKDLDEAVNDRKRTLPSWMSGSSSSTNKDTSNKNNTSNAIQHGRKNNKPTQKRPNTSKLKDDSSIKNNDYVEEMSEKEKKSPKNSPTKFHVMSQNNDKEIAKKKNEQKEKLGKNKSPLKRSPKVSPAKKTPSKYHGLSQDVNDDEISEEYDSEIKNTTSNNQHNLSDDGIDNITHSPQNNLPSPRKIKTPEKESLSSENEDGNDAEFESNKTKNTVGSRLAGVTTTTTTTTNTSTGDVEGRGRKRAAPRGSCAYGSQCYRKNPQHKVEYAHPGDSDYNEDDSEDEDGDDDDEREECEFGIDCYRKNPQHRKEFKHTRVPQPQRTAKRKGKAKKRRSDESESDDYDYDDPFLCDDSSDEYAPTDSGSDTNIEDNDVEEEDTGRLLKEGKKIIRNN